MLSLTAGAAALIAAQYPSLSVTNMKASMLASVTPVAGLNGYCQTNVSLATNTTAAPSCSLCARLLKLIHIVIKHVSPPRVRYMQSAKNRRFLYEMLF